MHMCEIQFKKWKVFLLFLFCFKTKQSSTINIIFTKNHIKTELIADSWCIYVVMRYDIQELQTDDIKSAKGMSMHPFLQLPRPTDFSVSSLLTAGNGSSAGNTGHSVNSSTTSGNMKIPITK